MHFVLGTRSYSMACDLSTQPPDTHKFFKNAKSPKSVYPGITKDAKTQIEDPDYTSFHQNLHINLFICFLKSIIVRHPSRTGPN